MKIMFTWQKFFVARQVQEFLENKTNFDWLIGKTGAKVKHESKQKERNIINYEHFQTLREYYQRIKFFSRIK